MVDGTGIPSGDPQTSAALGSAAAAAARAKEKMAALTRQARAENWDWDRYVAARAPLKKELDLAVSVSKMLMEKLNQAGR